MKILMINVVCGVKSTGRICTDLAFALEEQGHEVKIAYGRDKVPERFQKYAVKIGTDLGVAFHGIKARMWDAVGFGSVVATKRLVEWIRQYDPDVIHLHNIHGYYINIDILFNYLRTSGKKIIWTLHDCWSFTGHCAYFDYVRCDKWKEECKNCSQRKGYPARMLIDRSKENYRTKKTLFSGIPNLSLVAPSKWLADLVTESFLCDYPIKVIHNGIDTDAFKPFYGDILTKYDINGKIIILGVAAVWDSRKGLDTFVQLAKNLGEKYRIILVGLSKRQVKKMPENIIGITRTDSIQELVALYTVADVFVNPTLEDNYPTTNLEAIACGTPVITYDTGGSVESAVMYGRSVSKSIEQLVEAIQEIDKIQPGIVDVDLKSTVNKYLELYNGIGDM